MLSSRIAEAHVNTPVHAFGESGDHRTRTFRLGSGPARPCYPDVIQQAVVVNNSTHVNEEVLQIPETHQGPMMPCTAPDAPVSHVDSLPMVESHEQPTAKPSMKPVREAKPRMKPVRDASSVVKFQPSRGFAKTARAQATAPLPESAPVSAPDHALYGSKLQG